MGAGIFMELQESLQNRPEIIYWEKSLSSTMFQLKLLLDLKKKKIMNWNLNDPILSWISICAYNLFLFIVGTGNFASKGFCSEQFVQGVRWDESVPGNTIFKKCPNNQNRGLFVL